MCICCCGAQVRVGNKAHEKSKKHQKYLEELKEDKMKTPETPPVAAMGPMCPSMREKLLHAAMKRSAPAKPKARSAAAENKGPMMKW